MVGKSSEGVVDARNPKIHCRGQTRSEGQKRPDRLAKSDLGNDLEPRVGEGFKALQEQLRQLLSRYRSGCRQLNRHERGLRRLSHAFKTKTVAALNIDLAIEGGSEPT